MIPATELHLRLFIVKAISHSHHPALKSAEKEPLTCNNE